MKIASIETFTTKEINIVRIRTDDGKEGYGQTAPYIHANIAALVLHQQISPYVLGADVSRMEDIAPLSEKCIEGEHKFPGSYVCRAVGGVDTALWDLHGKIQNKSVCELLGGTQTAVQVYGSSMSRSITPEQEAERLTRLKQSHGFKAFKIRIGSPFGHDEDAWPGRTEAIVPAVREAIGPDTLLYVDANSGFSPERAIEVGHMLEQYDVCHYEEPCPYPELEWTQQVNQALSLAVTGGEQDTCLAQFKRMISMRAVDIVQPDICYVGGLSRALKVAKMAEEAGIACTPHSANLSMVTVFTLHMMGAIPNAGPFMEYTIEWDNSWTDGLFMPPLKVVDGSVAIPKGPGWGVQINKEWLEKADYRITSL
ncbi:mandelate racemase/muconate lactonizing enzyme family protein [Paenibacillus solisilvae]|uniref:Mandelate racemase/muconate lactonizing enzyme family protein n=1 Tax=Paenibacillus solisilvae TaxID=2486751 RepID=A0ABW0WAE1_9BACL